jgi:hypothetical protein
MDFWRSRTPMLLSNSERRAVTTAVFGVTIALLLVVAASGFVLYGTRSTMQETSTVTMTETMGQSASTSGSMNESASPAAVAFVPVQGQMFGSGWLIIASLGNGDYALSLHATGLESASMGSYIVEAAQNSGQMATVPIAGSNATLSEFEADSSGNGQFFTVLMENPRSAYESVSIVYLPGMEMQNAAVVATAALTM